MTIHIWASELGTGGFQHLPPKQITQAVTTHVRKRSGHLGQTYWLPCAVFLPPPAPADARRHNARAPACSLLCQSSLGTDVTMLVPLPAASSAKAASAQTPQCSCPCLQPPLPKQPRHRRHNAHAPACSLLCQSSLGTDVAVNV
eukprot:364721-Chlamydomonas_euryale.AAC.6